MFRNRIIKISRFLVKMDRWRQLIWSEPFICLFKYTHAPQPGNWPQDPVCRTGFSARSSIRKDLDVDDWQWLTVVRWWFQLFEYIQSFEIITSLQWFTQLTIQGSKITWFKVKVSTEITDQRYHLMDKDGLPQSGQDLHFF